MKRFIKPDFVLVSAIMFANFANYAFNALLGRALSFEEYGALALINTLWYVYSIFLNSLSTTANHTMAFLKGGRKFEIIPATFESMKKGLFRITVVCAILWTALIPVFIAVFNVQDWIIFASLTPIIVIGSFVALSKGYLQGQLLFNTLATLIVAESLSKFIYAVIFVLTGLENIAYLAIPLSVTTAFIFTSVVTKPVKLTKSIKKQPFPKKFYLASVLTSFSSAAFLTVDIILAKLFLSPEEAGKYALLSLVGKMIYFIGSILNSFIVTYVSKSAGEKGDTKTAFYKLILFSSIITGFAYFGVGTLGWLTIPLLLGEKADAILPYLQIYGLGIAIFTITSTVSAYHLSLKRYIFSRIGIMSTILLSIGLLLFHDDIYSFSWIILVASTIYFLVAMLMHLYFTHWIKPHTEISKLPILEYYREKLPIAVSICLPAYNEEKNVGKLLSSLLSQETKHFKISKIVVVSSASTDKTDDIVREYASKDSRVQLLREEKRNGKASAINLFLQDCSEHIVVLQSTDTVCEKNTIENLCFPFLTDKNIGMTGGAPVPVNDPNTFLGYVVHAWWWFHRHIPRFGEIIAFRNILTEISAKTAVDEAYIQAKFIQLSYKVVHVDEAIIYNKGADSVQDMIKQRRRIYNGHSRLHKEEKVKINNLTKKALWLLLFKYEIHHLKQVVWILGGIAIEAYANILGRWDKYISKKNPYIWDIAKSTKKVVYDK